MELVKDENGIDINKATLTVIRYFEEIHGNLGLLSFRVQDVRPNSDENIWIVDCNFYPSLGNKERVYYNVKVNIKTGKINSVKQVNKNDKE